MEPDGLLDVVTTAVDRLVESGERHDGLFPSMLDRETGEMLRTVPEPLPGQRQHDRAHRGSNLTHDEPLLRTMYALAERDGRGEYADAADRYLETFATECARRDHRADGTGSATGLFPWGEHAYWHLEEWRVGNSRAYAAADPGPAIHDHLRLAPAWLWEKLCEYEPRRVHDFADGLRYHWNDPDAPEYVRHAYVTRKERYPVGDRACDFPRHGGHYVFDWAFAYTRERHPEYVRRIGNLLDYWWERRDDDDLLPLESRGYSDSPSPGQTLSYVVSLFDAADLLADRGLAPDLRERLCERGRAHLDGYLDGPGATPDERLLGRPLWAAIYGGSPVGATAATAATKCLCAYRQTGEETLLEWARTAGEAYRETPLPAEGYVDAADAPFDDVVGVSHDGSEVVPIWAFAPGSALALFADLYALTDERAWLDDGLDLADVVVDVYLDAALPSAAGSVDYYENQLGSGFLLYGLARLALLARDGEDPSLFPDYTAR